MNLNFFHLDMKKKHWWIIHYLLVNLSGGCKYLKKIYQPASSRPDDSADFKDSI